MSLTATVLIILALGIIISGVLLLKKTARKFNITNEQLENIKRRNEELVQAEKDD